MSFNIPPKHCEENEPKDEQLCIAVYLINKYAQLSEHCLA